MSEPNPEWLQAFETRMREHIDFSHQRTIDRVADMLLDQEKKLVKYINDGNRKKIGLIEELGKSMRDETESIRKVISIFQSAHKEVGSVHIHTAVEAERAIALAASDKA